MQSYVAYLDKVHTPTYTYTFMTRFASRSLICATLQYTDLTTA